MNTIITLLALVGMIFVSGVCHAKNLCAEYVAKKEFDKALAECTSLLDSEADALKAAKAYLGRAEAYYGKGQFDLAIADASSAIALGLVEGRASTKLEKSYSEKEALQAALAAGQAVGSYSTARRAYILRGDARAVLKLTDLAMADFSEAIVLNPDDAEAYYHRAVVHDEEKRFNQAIGEYTKVIQLDPKRVDAYTDRGISFESNGQPDLAAADYDKAIELDPNSAMAHYRRGFVYYKHQKQYEPAIREYRKALDLNMKEQIVYHDLAALSSLTGNMQDACKYLRIVRDLGGRLGSVEYIKGDQELDAMRSAACYQEIVSGK